MYTKDHSSILYTFTIRILRFEYYDSNITIRIRIKRTMAPTPPSYLAPFQPNVYVFEQSCGKIAYSEHPTVNDVPSTLTSQFQNTSTCMKCLIPSTETILDSDCEQTWLNIKEPTMNLSNEQVSIPKYQQFLSGQMSATLKGMESIESYNKDAPLQENTNSANAQMQQLITQLTQTTNNPYTLHSLRVAFREACENGITYMHDEGKYAASILDLLREAIDNETLPVYPPSDPTIKIQFTESATSDSESISGAIQRGIRYYNKERNQFNNIIHNIVTANKTLNDAIVNNYQTITALQKKIDLAYQVLQAEGNKLHELTHNYANTRAQTEQSRHNRVAIGFPYMDPMFTMSQRNYVIMMLCFIVMLVIGILVYAFVGRKRYTGDVVGTTDGGATSGSGAATTATPTTGQ